MHGDTMSELPASFKSDPATREWDRDMIVLIGYDTAVSLTVNFSAVPAGSPGLVR